jgi:hypothetical protein
VSSRYLSPVQAPALVEFQRPVVIRLPTDVSRGNQVFPVVGMGGFHVSGYAYLPVAAAD